jgi:flagellar FliL protein
MASPAPAPPAADAEAPPKKSKKPLLVGLVLALLGGGGGFYATWSGLILGGGETAAADDHGGGDHGEGHGDGHGDGQGGALPGIAFVPVDPVVITLGPGARSDHLRMTAQLEVDAAHAAEVEHLKPRILDVLNGYLRAIEVAELEDPAALVRIRAQLLRRIQIVTGDGRVRDLLVTEFVLN